MGSTRATIAMPAPIISAITALRTQGDGTIEDPTWRDRLIERFGSRWRHLKLRVKKGGHAAVGSDTGGITIDCHQAQAAICTDAYAYAHAKAQS